MIKELKWVEQEIPLVELILSDALKVREPDKGTITKYAKSYKVVPNDFPPLKAAKIGKAVYLVDGWHRYLAAQQAGLTSLPVLTARMSQQQAASEAAKANSKHGRGVTGEKEKARVIEMYFGDPANLQKPVRLIAAELPGIISKSQAQRIKAAMTKEEQKEQEPWGAEELANAKQERLEQDARAAIKTLETHWNRLDSPETKRDVLRQAKETLGKLIAEAAKLPPNILDI